VPEPEGAPAPPMLAWGDESGSISSIDPGVYVMAAVIAGAQHADALRDGVRPLLRKGEKKLHWRTDADRRHDSVIGAIVELPIEAFVVVRRGPATDKSERRRRKCLETLLPELTLRGCDHLVMESRGPTDDRRDRDMLDAMRAKKEIVGLRLDHAPGPADPVLWIADAVCGAVVAHRTGESRWLEAIADRVMIRNLDHGL